MAKKFAGFTPEQLGKIDPSLQGKQSDEQNAIIAANPALAARVGKMAMAAQKRINMAYGGMVKKGFNTGGMSLEEIQAQNEAAARERILNDGDPSNDHLAANIGSTGSTGGGSTGGGTSQADIDTLQQRLADAQQRLNEAMAASQANPEDESLANAVTAAQAEVNSAQVALNNATAGFEATNVPSPAEVRDTLINDPGSVGVTADVQTTTDEQKEAGTIEEGTGQVDTKTEASVETVDTTKTVGQPDEITTKTYEPLEVTADVEDIMERLEEVTGEVGPDALVKAQTMSPDELAQLGLSAAQIEKAQTVQGAPTRVLEEGELIDGSTVDMDRVKEETNFEAATGQPSSNATVQGQLGQLMEQFEGTNPPPWAAGALRAAASMMASRGLSASSMAGQAAVQAAMEAALPIANADAQTFARFESQNLSNRQQSAMFAAEQRAKFLGLEFTQEFQTKVANAAKISDIANINFTAEQQVALENARLAQTVDLANLQAANAKVLSDAAALTKLDLTNLTNLQQAEVQNAKAFLQMDLTNLSYQQQDKLFKAQSMVKAMLSDQAATNASNQFNAASENQTNQFMANLEAQISMFNSEQFNLMEQFNAGQTNAMSQFNANLEAAREQFNASNALVIAQANANWAQSYTLADNAATNAANRDFAMFTNELTMTGYNNILQYERDSISYAFKAFQNDMQRELQLLIEQMRKDVDLAKAQANIDMKAGEARGALEQIIFNKVLDWAF